VGKEVTKATTVDVTEGLKGEAARKKSRRSRRIFFYTSLKYR
jgi:hypothetical protein